MSSKEVIAAMEQKAPVVYKGVTYTCIKQYVLSYDQNNKQVRTVALLDKNGNCLVYALAKDVALAPAA